MRLYGEIIDRTGAQTMLYLTCTTKSSVDLAQYGVSVAKVWVSVECGTIAYIFKNMFNMFNIQVQSTTIKVQIRK